MKKIIAVSGGPDSMYLLYTLLEKYDNKDLIVATLDYKKRIESVNEVKKVINFCKQNKIKIHILNCSSRIYKKYNDINNFQYKARIMRYDFFFKLADKYQTNEIYLGHNKDDFIETAIINKNRSDNYFFYGIKEINYIRKYKIIRPLLNLWKKDIQDLCNKYNIPYSIDSSNLEKKYIRNKIRIENNSLKNKLDQFNYFTNLNLNLESNYKKVDNTLTNWIDKEYSIKFYRENVSEKFSTNLLYLYLIRNLIDIKISSNKLLFLDKYIRAFNNESKMYQINDKYSIAKKDKKILIRRMY